MYFNTPIDKLYFLDIEANSLDPDTVWCCVILNKQSRQIWRFINNGSASIYHELKKFFEDRKDAVFVGHNILSYDGYYLGKLCGFEWPYDRSIDTLTLSYLYNPALDGGHSLSSYGIRLKFLKGDYSDWSKFSQEMLEYCERDVTLLELVYDALQKRMREIGFSEQSAEIEHRIRTIIDQQTRNGFYLFRDRAESLLQFLTKRESDLAEGIHELFPPELETVGEYRRRFRKDGSYTAQYEKHVTDTNLIIKDYEDGSYGTLQYKPFNIGSSKQRLERLLRLGYEPTAKTKKGNPKIDEDSLLAYAKECNRPEISAMAEWLVTTGRKKLIGGNPETGAKGWLGWVTSESRIHGHVLTCGATSRRMRHFDPNLANVPSPQNGAAYGEECRSLWGITPDLDRALVGYDAKGLETHVMCHFLGNSEANKLLLEGDVHDSNQIALQSALDAFLGPSWGTVVRGGGGAKTALYAAIYGAYPPKLGSIFKQGKAAGEVVQRVLYNNVPGLGKAFKSAQEEWRQTREGFMRCIDGGYVRCPTESAAFNYRIQPNGGILMKMTAILLDQRLREKGIWHMKVADVHDEGQHETQKKDAQELGQTATQSITDAGEELGFRVKMSGNYKIGDNWSQTH